jgi:3-hydroxyisobutyrate dehydrogenase-like beta-hydroxyacid dehydrogenase
MGTACGTRLLAAGYRVIAYDVDTAALNKFEATGGETTASLAELVRTCSHFVLAVFNTDQVEAIIEGAQGLLALAPGDAGPMVVVCVSTCDPDRIAALFARIPAARLRFVESPISGTSEQTRRGEGLALVGGDSTAVQAAAPIVEAICPRRHHLGPAGSGGRAKLGINLILGVNRAALAEGLVFVERMGLDAAAFLEVARESAAYSQIMDVKGPTMLQGDFTPRGKVKQSLKDFELMQEQAARLNQRLPLAETYIDLVEGCIAHGEAELDNSIVIQEIRRRIR